MAFDRIYFIINIDVKEDDGRGSEIIFFCQTNITYRGVMMDLTKPSEENLKYILEQLLIKLNVVNRALLDPVDYDLNKYEDLKFMYDVVLQKGRLSAPETEAFISELRTTRKSQ